MPRYEIVAHVTREFDCETAEEAAVVFRRQLGDEDSHGDNLLHLALWRDEPMPQSPLPPVLRQQLVSFFHALDRCASDAEEEFRGRVEAILTAPATIRAAEASGDPPGRPPLP